LSREHRTQIVVGTDQLATDLQFVFCTVPFTLANEGDIASQPVVLTFRYPLHLFRRQLLDELGSPDNKALEVRHSFKADGQFEYSSYEFDTVKPHVGIEISEPFYAHPTFIQLETNAVSKDGVNILVPLFMLYSTKFGISLSVKDAALRSYDIDIAFVPATSLDDTFQKASTYVAEADAKSVRQNTGILRYLWMLLTGASTQRIFVYYEKQEELVRSDKVTIFSPKLPIEARTLAYRTADWKRLLN
jgi:hypothetical protein